MNPSSVTHRDRSDLCKVLPALIFPLLSSSSGLLGYGLFWMQCQVIQQSSRAGGQLCEDLSVPLGHFPGLSLGAGFTGGAFKLRNAFPWDHPVNSCVPLPAPFLNGKGSMSALLL